MEEREAGKAGVKEKGVEEKGLVGEMEEGAGMGVAAAMEAVGEARVARAEGGAVAAPDEY